MRILIFFLLTITCMSGCATASKTYTPDGKEGYIINCSGSALNWGMCYQKAGDICGKKGYEVVEKNGDTGSIVSGNQFGVYGGSIVNRTMIIKCKECNEKKETN